jgi:small GTP-binding protein
MLSDHAHQDNVSALKLRYTLQGHTDTIRHIMWSPDGKFLASASADSTVRIWDANTGGLIKVLEGHTQKVNCVAWIPNDNILLSGSEDWTLRLWNIADEQQNQIILWQEMPIRSVSWSQANQEFAIGTDDGSIWLGSIKTMIQDQMRDKHTSAVHSLAWSPDGHTLASASLGGTTRLWDMTTRSVRITLDGYTTVAWSPDAQIVASPYYDNAINLWYAETGHRTGILEGHTNSICSLAFSCDGSLLASKSNDHTIRLWRCNPWELVAVLPETTNLDWPSNLAFHPSELILATLGERDRVIRIWDIDRAALLHAPSTSNIHYTNAKVVLVGDSGVGKSGLALVLSGRSFAPTESTHGRHIWVFDSQKVRIDDQREETRETLLWDLAGQPGYRIIHQLHLNEVAIALVVFDARSELDPFAGVRHWDRALRQAQRTQSELSMPLKKYLVAARIDRGGASASRERIKALVHDLGFDGYFETSAKDSLNIAPLRATIRDAIDWSQLPKVISTTLFQQIKNFLITEKSAARLLSSSEDLYRAFLKNPDIPTKIDELRLQFETCIGRVESRGLIRHLNFGNLILLQPEMLDAYASALVNAAKEEPDGLGCIKEDDARVGRFLMSDEERVKDKDQEKLLLIATIEDMLRHEIAIREPADDGGLLIFPSQLTREHPDVSDPEGIVVIFSFEGPVFNAYATLAVRLSHSGIFKKQELWKNAAIFRALVGGTCGVFLQEIGEGSAELAIFFDPTTTEETRFYFEQFIHTHLQRRTLPTSLRRRRIFVCGSCQTPVSDLQAQRRRERGFEQITCNVCDNQVSLLDREERLTSTRSSSVYEMDRAADTRRDLETAESVLQGKIVTGDIDIQTWELIVLLRRRLHELEKQRAYFGPRTPPEIKMEIEDLHRQTTLLELKLNKGSGRSI